MRYLCVGGPMHGHFVEVQRGRKSFIAPILPPVKAAWWTDHSPDATIKTVEYELYDFLTDRPIWLART